MNDSTLPPIGQHQGDRRADTDYPGTPEATGTIRTGVQVPFSDDRFTGAVRVLNDAINLLSKKEYRDIAQDLLNRHLFKVTPASIDYHHSFTGGLLVHTAEVMQYALLWSEGQHDSVGQVKIECDVLVLSCLFHDCGKIQDYIYASEGFGHPSRWMHSQHKDCFDHIARSAFTWRSIATSIFEQCEGAYREINIEHQCILEHVSHCILAHHQLREWGSPVRPRTPTAWAVHLADMMSGFGTQCKEISWFHRQVRDSKVRDSKVPHK